MKHLDPREEDYITRLFRQNQDKLDEMPRDEVWMRLEKRLDGAKEQPSEGQNSEPLQRQLHKAGSWRPYWAAASAVLILVSAALLYQYAPDSDSPNNLEPIAQAELPSSAQSESPKESPSRIEDQAQAERIVAQAQSQNKRVKDLAKVEIAEKPGSIEVPKVALAPSPTSPAGDLPRAEKEEARRETQGLSLNSSNAGLNAPQADAVVQASPPASSNYYAAPPPRPSFEVAELELADEPSYAASSAKKREGKTSSKEKAPSRSEAPRILNRSAAPAAPKPSQSQEGIKQVHASLSVFTWMLGSWKDEGLNGGISYEDWHILDEYTLQGKGYKVRKNDKIFEEKMRLVYKPELKQIFLYMSVQDGQQPIEYMLSKVSGEQMLFVQKELPGQPDEVILQREAQGAFSVTVKYQKGQLNSNQQSYLQNRHRVSNMRALRVLKPN